MTPVEVGQSIGEVVVPVDRARLVRYAGASGDFNRIHWDEKFATSVGLPDVIAHGMWTMGAAVQLVVDWIGDAGAVTSYGVRFSKPIVVPYDEGAQLTVSGQVKSVDGDQATIALTAKCGEDAVLVRALATVRLT